MLRKPSEAEVHARHNLTREPPLPIYIGLNVHAVSRNKRLIEMLYHMGISVSYDRIMELEDWLATSVCERFEEDGVVSPPCLRNGLFTVGALDNLDHNPSSTTSMSSFHGTGISLFQFPTKVKPGDDRPSVSIPPSGTRKLVLPESYASVPAVSLKTSTVEVQPCHMEQMEEQLAAAISQEENWIKHALPILKKEELSADSMIVWAAYQ